MRLKEQAQGTQQRQHILQHRAGRIGHPAWRSGQRTPASLFTRACACTMTHSVCKGALQQDTVQWSSQKGMGCPGVRSTGPQRQHAQLTAGQMQASAGAGSASISICGVRVWRRLQGLRQTGAPQARLLCTTGAPSAHHRRALRARARKIRNQQHWKQLYRPGRSAARTPRTHGRGSRAWQGLQDVKPASRPVHPLQPWREPPHIQATSQSQHHSLLSPRQAAPPARRSAQHRYGVLTPQVWAR